MTLSPKLREELTDALADRYRLGAELDHGGMAWVFRATDLKHHREVAIKILRSEIGAALGGERFEREIAIAARLNHPHIVPLFDSGRAGDHLFYVMPFVAGESLRRRLIRAPIPVAEALRITRDVAAGLSHAHAHGVIHRDIKPENILLSGGSALIADFGIALPTDQETSARLTETGISIGTVDYMSPEQLAGERQLDARTDVYSLACVLYEMLAGHPPHAPPGSPPREIAGRRLSGVAPGQPPSFRQVDGLAELARAALVADPERRTATVEALITQLDAVTAPKGIEPRRVQSGRPGVVVAGVLVVALAVVFLSTRSDPAPSGPDLAAIAVLPFANLSADREDEYFSDGLGEELISRLSQIPGLRVAPRTSSWAFKGRNVDLKAIGDSLDVGSVVEGSVRRSGDVLRVTSRLIRTADATPLWSKTFDEGRLRDILAIQDTITDAIATAIRAKVGPSSTVASDGAQTGSPPPGGGPRPRGTTAPEAQDLYYRARYDWNRRTAPGMTAAVTYFQQALAIDSGYVDAWIGLADAFAVGSFYEYFTPADAMPKARAAATRALALAPEAGEAYSTLGYFALWHDWNLPEAERMFRRAIELTPRYPQAHQYYANMLTAAGRFPEARAQWREAAAIEPLAMIMTAAQVWTEFFAGEHDQAIAIGKRAIERDSTFYLAHHFTGLSLEAKQAYGAAEAAFRRAASLTNGGPIPLSGLARTLALAGRRDSAVALLADLGRRSRPEPVPPVDVAAAHLALGDLNETWTWLDRAVANRSHGVALLPIDPRFARLRGERRFQEIVARVTR
jgi:serine/threonine protein kinase/tetratricopeptide (TPR) repeat protein